MKAIFFNLRSSIFILFVLSFILGKAQNHLLVGYFQNNVVVDSVLSSYFSSPSFNISTGKNIDIDSDGTIDFDYTYQKSSSFSGGPMSQSSSYFNISFSTYPGFSLALNANYTANNYTFTLGTYTSVCNKLKPCQLMEYVDTMQFAGGNLIVLKKSNYQSNMPSSPGLISSYNCTSFTLFGSTPTIAYFYISYKKQTPLGFRYGWFKIRRENYAIQPNIYENIYFYKPDTTWINTNTLEIAKNNHSFFDAIKLYPNPTNETFKVTDVFENLKVEIYDSRGIKVKEEVLKSNLKEINVRELPNGLYITKILYPNGSVTRKLVVQKLE